MKNEKSTLDNGYTTLLTYDNGVQYIIQGSASHIVSEDGIGFTLKNKHFPKVEEVKETHTNGKTLYNYRVIFRDGRSVIIRAYSSSRARQIAKTDCGVSSISAARI